MEVPLRCWPSIDAEALRTNLEANVPSRPRERGLHGDAFGIAPVDPPKLHPRLIQPMGALRAFRRGFGAASSIYTSFHRPPSKNARKRRPASPNALEEDMSASTTTTVAGSLKESWHDDDAGVPKPHHRHPPVEDPTSLDHVDSDAPERKGLDDNNDDGGTSVDDEGNTYPEGGLRAWLVVAGSFSGMMASFGYMNTVGTYQAYISTHQLSSYSDSSIGWIFSVYIFLSFGAGVQCGPLFDQYGPFWLVVAGATSTLLSVMLLGVCTAYWHFMLVFGVLGGFGTALIFTPAVSSVGHFFHRRRGHATGIATCGGALGGVLFPLTLQALLPRLGWARATQIQGGIVAVLLLAAISLIRARLPPRPRGRRRALPDPTVFRDPAFALLTLGSSFLELALFLPIAYITSYALQTRGAVSPAFAYQILAVFNAASFVGRWVPGYVADRVGRYNTQIAAVCLCAGSALGLWLPATVLATDAAAAAAASSSPQNILGLTVAFAVLMGFASGSNISLTPVCIGMLCPTQEYGRYVATAYTVVSFGTLIGVPIAGALISACDGSYWGVALFTGVSYMCGLACFVAVRVMKVGWKVNLFY